MDIQRPLFWHQGLFLQPQHFQLLDLSFRSLLVPFHDFMQPEFWGTGGIEIEKAALGTGTFSLLNGSFLFPDGTYAVLHGNAVADARTFDAALIEGGKPLGVFVGLRKWNTAGENVTVLEKTDTLSDVTTRFVTGAEPEEIRDLHSDGPAGQVKRLSYVLRIFWETETELLGDYDLLQIARLEREGEDIVLSPGFVPPCLTISGSDILLKLIREIRDQTAARSRQLEEYKRQRGIQSAEFGSRDMVYLLALRSLNRYVPLLFHYTETGRVHPWAVYGTVRQLIGELSSFSENVNVMGESGDGVPALPNYDHGRLWECFSAAAKTLTRLIDEITAGPEYIIKLVYDGTYYAADLKPAVFEGRNRFFLVCRTAEDHRAVLNSLTSLAKLSSREHLPILIARALPGIGLESLQVPPQELPRRADCLYFAVDRHSEQWGFVEKGNNIALYWDNAPEDLEVELMVVGK
ncbi:MAG: type VI secretion system baseplate subunit TssK [Deferribacteres bacterium]|nr:type VI secretion system baseplate subunit TssK [Deferribacteres bacterium]